MKVLIKLEELAMLLISLFLLWNANASWYWYLLLLIGPDIGMLGYMVNNSVGAAVYNVFHHKGIALAIFVMGIYLNDVLTQQIGIVLFGHAAMDRIFGYGLKYNKGFAYTHLGMIGNKALGNTSGSDDISEL
ncbi:hypothetical protein PIECOFPK_02821 [Mycovorax composti]|jgi:hypothetical protein|uniref:DUF4260 family protein n=2 Tax=Chitinophagaceae TaxID=563835 RepID=A0ABZ2ENQ9_9BACT